MEPTTKRSKNNQTRKLSKRSRAKGPKGSKKSKGKGHVMIPTRKPICFYPTPHHNPFPYYHPSFPTSFPNCLPTPAPYHQPPVIFPPQPVVFPNQPIVFPKQVSSDGYVSSSSTFITFSIILVHMINALFIN